MRETIRAGRYTTTGRKRRLFLIAAVLLLSLTLFACAQPPEKAKPVKATDEKVEQESKLLTKDQKKIIDTFGRPKQFILAYTPIGGDDGLGLSRTEIWYYPLHHKKITFAAGEILSVRAMENPKEDVSYSDAHIEDFDFSMDYKEVIEALGIEKAEPIEFAGDIFEEDEVESYLGEKVTFTIEQGHLTYMQTLGVKK